MRHGIHVQNKKRTASSKYDSREERAAEQTTIIPYHTITYTQNNEKKNAYVLSRVDTNVKNDHQNFYIIYQ